MLRTRLIAGATSGFVLSAVIATALTIASFCETFVEPWRVDPGRPAPITLRLPRTTLRTTDPKQGVQFATLSRTVVRGEVVRDEALATMVRMHERARRPPRAAHLAAQWLVYMLALLVMTTFLRSSSSKRGALLRTQVGLLVATLLFLLGAKGMLLFSGLSPYFMPVTLLPLLTALYVDRRTGVLLAAVLSLLSASLVGYDPIVSVVYLTSSTVGALYFRHRKQSYLLLVAGLLSGITGGLVYVGTKEIFDGFDLAQAIALQWRSGPAATFAAGLGAGLGAFVLQPLVSRLLGVVSRAQLLNLTDLDHPLLQKMAREAPGSWEHSRAMANLAEQAAASIHADALLTRTGAYYHDLGKTCQPKYFVENLDPGERTPHDDLDPDVSADAIMAHVVEGTRILREGGIPEPVVEFSYTHHGTSVIEFFWGKCLKQGNPKGLEKDDFRYQGMRPRTKETAILMLIDSIEAGARTVDPPSREGFEELVRRVIFSKLEQGQLDDSGLEIDDLRVLATRIIDTLCNVYHSRIRYPWQDQDKDKEGDAGASDGAAETAQSGTHAPQRDA